MRPARSPGTPRITGRTLQAIRARILRRDPLCKRCLAKRPPRVSASTEVDHVVCLYRGGSETDDNRQGLCAACHKDKTREDMNHRPRPEIGLDGWPIDE